MGLMQSRIRFALTVVLLASIVSSGALAEDAGRSLFRVKCSGCHLANGAPKKDSKMAIPDLRSKKIRAMSDRELYETIAEGTKHKEYPHAFLYTGMTEDQIRSIVAYIRTFK